MRSEIRKDYLLNKYVIISSKRGKRPHSIGNMIKQTKDDSCPFCPDSISYDDVVDLVGTKKSWQVLSLKNIFPAVSVDNKRAYGYQEVIVETQDHYKRLADLKLADIENILKMFAKRTKSLSRDKKIDYVLCFKNDGIKAGASLSHSHSQIFASEIVSPEVREELDLAKDYKKQTGKCYWCDLIEKELKSDRIIFKDKKMIAFTPYASQFQYEAWIFTKRHIDNITRLDDQEIKSLAKILKIILLKLKSLGLSYNFFLHQIISDRDQHFCLKIQPRGSVWAGLELGSGLVINSVLPEEAAEFYRK